MPQKKNHQEMKWDQRTLIAVIHPERLLKTAGFSGCPKNSCASTSMLWKKAALQTKRKRKAEINAWSPADLSVQQHRRKPLWLMYGHIIYCLRSSAIIILRMERKNLSCTFSCEQRDKSFLHLGDHLHWLPAMLKFLLDASHLNFLLITFPEAPYCCPNKFFPLPFLMFSVFNLRPSSHSCRKKNTSL